MGYTHYWHQSRDLTPAEWSKVRDAFNHIAQAAEADGLTLANGHGDQDTAPEIDAERIAFNGVGPESYETFWLDREARHRDGKPGTPAAPVFNFCKTQARPYDRAAVALLCYLATAFPDAFDVASDGMADDWQDGLTLARNALGHAEGRQTVALPAKIEQEA